MTDAVMRQSQYTCTVVPGRCLYLEDVNDGGRTLTNSMERVVPDLYAANLLEAGMLLIYRDSEGRVDEVRHTDGRFVSFNALETLP